MPTILQLDLQQIISQALSFLLLLWVLKRFAWKPLLAMLDARRTRIEEGIRQIDQGKAGLVKLEQELKVRLEKIDEEARAKIQEAVQEGRRVAMEIQDEARAQSQAILTKSKETIELELAKAKVTLRDQMAQMTVDATERLLKQKVDRAADQALISSILDELAESKQP